MILRFTLDLRPTHRLALHQVRRIAGAVLDSDRGQVHLTGFDDAGIAQLVTIELQTGEEVRRVSCPSHATPIGLLPGGDPILGTTNGTVVLANGVLHSHGIELSIAKHSPDRQWLLLAGYKGSWLLQEQTARAWLCRSTLSSEWASVAPIPLQLTADDLRSMALPEELRRFLGAGKSFEYEPTTCLAGRVTLHRLDQLRYCTRRVSSYCTDVESEDPAVANGEDDGGWYLVPMVSLTASCEYYQPDHLLTWLPEERLFGTYDAEHQHLRVFPAASWRDICSDPVRYINSQWKPDDEIAQDARPWLIEGRLCVDE